MDFATIIGVLVAFGMVFMGIISGSPLTLFVDIPSVMITIGGTFGIIFINYPLKDVVGVFGVIRNVFFNQRREVHVLIPLFVNFASQARREGILVLESAAEELRDPFFKKGLELVIDGLEPQAIREILETEIEHIEQRHIRGADILNSIGMYAPAMGMVGTLIGLGSDAPVHVRPLVHRALHGRCHYHHLLWGTHGKPDCPAHGRQAHHALQGGGHGEGNDHRGYHGHLGG